MAWARGTAQDGWTEVSPHSVQLQEQHPPITTVPSSTLPDTTENNFTINPPGPVTACSTLPGSGPEPAQGGFREGSGSREAGLTRHLGPTPSPTPGLVISQATAFGLFWYKHSE